MAIHFGISMDNHLVQPGHLDLLVLIRKLLGLADHLLDLFFRQAALVVGDGDLLLRLRSSWRWFFSIQRLQRIHRLAICLVVYLPLWKIWVRQLGWLFIIPNIWKVIKAMFQSPPTSNQWESHGILGPWSWWIHLRPSIGIPNATCDVTVAQWLSNLDYTSVP